MIRVATQTAFIFALWLVVFAAGNALEGVLTP